MDAEIARQVKQAHELIADVKRPGWLISAEPSVWVGRLQARLQMLCDAIEDEQRQRDRLRGRVT